MFGGLQVSREDKVICRFPTRKAGALLAYLAYYPDQSHPREKLIDLFWPDLEFEAARHNLRQTLYSLRRLLEPADYTAGSILQTDTFSIRLKEHAFTTDIAAFGAALDSSQTSQQEVRLSFLLEAARLYRDQLLPGWYDDWIHAERETLAAAHEKVLRQLSLAWEQGSNWEQAIFYARKAVTANPYDETLHTRLIHLYIQSRQTAKAQQQYQALTRILREEWNTRPSPATDALLAALTTAPPSIIHASHDSAAIIQDSPEVIGESGTGTPEASSLPVPLTRFFGRETDMAQIGLLLDSCQARLLTLVGPAGCGKTRLAIEIGQKMRKVFFDRVYFVPLASVAGAQRLPDTILRALKIAPAPGQAFLNQIRDTLGDEPALLILDNFEHLVEEGCALVESLARQFPQLRLLITSRRRLAMEGERQYALLPLALPGREDRVKAPQRLKNRPDDTPERLLEFPGVAMFVDRAQAARHDFVLGVNNAQAVRDLCKRLEGLPLAIELAAARSGTLTPEQMLAQWQETFALLTKRHHGGFTAHTGLYESIESSFLQLSPDAQRALLEVSVFRGGWTLEAACSVSKSARMPDHLDDLRAFSLVQTQEQEETIRFQMLESVREYAWSKLSSRERLSLQRRHARCYARLAANARPHFTGRDAGRWYNRLETDHDNIRAALQWAVDREPTLALQMVKTLERFWSLRGYWTEGRAWLQKLQPLLPQAHSELQADIHIADGNLAWRQGDYAQATLHFEAARGLYQTIQSDEGLIRAFNNLGLVTYEQGKLEQARALQEEALSICHRSDNAHWTAGTSHNLANTLLHLDETERARTLITEALALNDRLGNLVWKAINLLALGKIALGAEQQQQAQYYFESGLAISRELEDSRGIVTALVMLAQLLWGRQQFDEALKHSEEALGRARDLKDNLNISAALRVQGLICTDMADYVRAYSVLRENALMNSKSGVLGGVSSCLLCFARLAVRQSQAERAVCLIGAVESVWAMTGAAMMTSFTVEAEEYLAAMRPLLNETTFQAAQERGRAFTLEQAVAYALDI